MGAMRWFAALGMGAALTLTGCGGDDDAADDAADPAIQTLTIHSTGALAFDPPDLEATAGEMRIVHEIVGSISHTFVIEGTDFKLVDDDEGVVDLAAGDYVFFCDVTGHRDAGMEGTLTVNS